MFCNKFNVSKSLYFKSQHRAYCIENKLTFKEVDLKNFKNIMEGQGISMCHFQDFNPEKERISFDPKEMILIGKMFE
jgi:hypothetical protein